MAELVENNGESFMPKDGFRMRSLKGTKTFLHTRDSLRFIL